MKSKATPPVQHRDVVEHLHDVRATVLGRLHPPEHTEEFNDNLARLINLSHEESHEVGGDFGFHQGFEAGAIIGAALQREPLGADRSAFVLEVIEKYAGAMRDWAKAELRQQAEYAKRREAVPAR